MVQTPPPSETFFGLDISNSKKSFMKLRRKISKRYLLIEFGTNSLTFGEAKVIKDQVYYNKVNRISIEQSAIERGTPTDCSAMASFISEIIEEEQIWAHRVAITLPPEASLSRIIYLPNDLNHQEAIEYIGNPAKSGFQFPISLEQTDFDLLPINYIPENREENTKAYFLNSVPKKLIDNIITTMEKANLELHVLDVAYSSLERLAYDSINKLKDNQVIFILELTLECSHIYIYSNCVPIYVNTITAIRNFEIPNNYEGDLSIEEAVVNSDEYLAISKLDLKVLFNEIRIEINKFKNDYEFEIEEILLSGINSCHTDIQTLIQNKFKINTSILRSLTSNDIGGLNHSNQICQQELNRLTGLGLSMVSIESLTKKEINSNPFETKLDNSKKPNKASLIEKPENIHIESNNRKSGIKSLNNNSHLDSQTNTVSNTYNKKKRKELINKKLDKNKREIDTNENKTNTIKTDHPNSKLKQEDSKNTDKIYNHNLLDSNSEAYNLAKKSDNKVIKVTTENINEIKSIDSSVKGNSIEIKPNANKNNNKFDNSLFINTDTELEENFSSKLISSKDNLQNGLSNNKSQNTKNITNKEDIKESISVKENYNVTDIDSKSLNNKTVNENKYDYDFNMNETNIDSKSLNNKTVNENNNDYDFNMPNT